MGKISCLGFGPQRDNLCELFEPLLSGLLWPANRFGVSDMAKVLVQGLREDVKVLFLESFTPLFDEFDLSRFGHWDEVTEGGLPEDQESSQTLRVLYCTRSQPLLLVRARAYFDHPMMSDN